MRNLFIFLISISLFSCQKKETTNASLSVSDSIQTTKDSEVKLEENKQKDDTIFLDFKDKNGFYTAEGSIDSLHSRIYVKFKNEDLGQLNANITPTTGKGNIRFNQIVFPDKTTDGPFGTDLKIDLEQKGNYILIIGHSQMADNPYWGKFKVQLENTKK